MTFLIPEPAAVFHARLLRCVDGDTLVMILDCHHGNESTKYLRLLGVDCPEMTGTTKAAGLAARDFVVRWLAHGSLENPAGMPFVVHTSKADSFGRWLSRVWRVSDGEELSEALLEAEFAIPRSAIQQVAEAQRQRAG